MIMGVNDDEGTVFVFLLDPTFPDDADYEQFNSDAYGATLGPLVTAEYPGGHTGASRRKAAAAAFGDFSFVCPTRRVASLRCTAPRRSCET